MTQMSDFARTIMSQKYLWEEKNEKEWADIAYRVTKNVLKAAGIKMSDPIAKEICQMITDRVFMPGGRYLYASGRPFHQVQNCFSGDTEFLTKTGVFSLKELKDQIVEVRNRFGEWEKAEVRCFGEQELYKIDLDNGEAIYATKEHLWWQPDGSRVPTSELKEVMLSRVEAYPEMDEEGIRHGVIFGDGHCIRNKTTKGYAYSQIVFVNPNKDQSLVKYFKDEIKDVEVGFGAKISVKTIRDTKRGTVVSLQSRRYKQLPDFKNLSPEYARGFIAGLIATDGCVSKSGSITISCEGFEKAKQIAKIAIQAGCIVTSVRVTNRTNPYNGNPREMSTVFIKPATAPIILPKHQEILQNRDLVLRKMTIKVSSVKPTGRTELVYCVVAPKTQSFTLASGLITSNCLLLRAEDSREGWAELMHKSAMALMTGAGIGIDYSDVRPRGSKIRKTGGFATGPIALMQMINEAGRGIMQGGSRRSAIWAGLNWKHKDCHEFLRLKNWSPEVRKLKEKDFNFPATMDGTNISVQLDDEFFEAYHDEKHVLHAQAQTVYWAVIKQMLSTAEPGFSIDTGANRRETLRNACTEVTSADDSDICNLGSINMAKITTLEQMTRVVELSTIFLLAGTLYSDVPYAKVDQVRTKNRRLGLGLMGLHEWLLLRGKVYGPDAELEEYLKIYAGSTLVAHHWADKWDISRPVKTRAVAPTGTIGILAETTTGIEPIFCAAFKRRYLKHTTWNYQYVLDPTAKRLVEERGINPDLIEDAYSISPERRVAFQSWLQQFVDHSISSTINLPAWGSEANNDSKVREFGDMLIKYLPKLRGITCYPDGARGGQPLTPVKYSNAAKQLGQVFTEAVDICDITKGGSCGT